MIDICTLGDWSSHVACFTHAPVWDVFLGDSRDWSVAQRQDKKISTTDTAASAIHWRVFIVHVHSCSAYTSSYSVVHARTHTHR